MKRDFLIFGYIVFVIAVSGCPAIIPAGEVMRDIGIIIVTDQVLNEIVEEFSAFCPAEFNRENFCILLGTDGESLIGNVYVQGNVTTDLGLIIRSKKGVVECQIKRGNYRGAKVPGCQFNSISSQKDLKITLIEKNSRTTIDSSKINLYLAKMKHKEVKKYLNKGVKVFKFLK